MNKENNRKLFREELKIELENKGVKSSDASIISDWIPNCLIDKAIKRNKSVKKFIKEMWGEFFI